MRKRLTDKLTKYSNRVCSNCEAVLIELLSEMKLLRTLTVKWKRVRTRCQQHSHEGCVIASPSKGHHWQFHLPPPTPTRRITHRCALSGMSSEICPLNR